MRTITSTFNTKAEAELASRRLSRIGVPPERISLREISAEDPGAPGAGGGEGAAVRAALLSAKVALDQVQAATAIMQGLWTADAVPPRSEDPEASTTGVLPGGGAARTSQDTENLITRGSVRFDDTIKSEPGVAEPPFAQARAPRPGHSTIDSGAGPNLERGSATHRPAATAARPNDMARWGRYLVYYALFLVAVFIFGAALGLVT